MSGIFDLQSSNYNICICNATFFVLQSLYSSAFFQKDFVYQQRSFIYKTFDNRSIFRFIELIANAFSSSAVSYYLCSILQIKLVFLSMFDLVSYLKMHFGYHQHVLMQLARYELFISKYF